MLHCGFDEFLNVDTSNPNYPKLSCKLGSTMKNSSTMKNGTSAMRDSTGEDNKDDCIILVIHYSKGDGFYKSKREFVFPEQLLEVKQELAWLLSVFSLTDSLINRVINSRTNGAKHWKKRCFPLPFKLGQVKAIFNLKSYKKRCATSFSQEDIDCAIHNIKILVECSARDLSFNLFDDYFKNWSIINDGSRKKKIAFQNYIDDVKSLRRILYGF